MNGRLLETPLGCTSFSWVDCQQHLILVKQDNNIKHDLTQFTDREGKGVNLFLICVHVHTIFSPIELRAVRQWFRVVLIEIIQKWPYLSQKWSVLHSVKRVWKEDLPSFPLLFHQGNGSSHIKHGHSSSHY